MAINWTDYERSIRTVGNLPEYGFEYNTNYIINSSVDEGSYAYYILYLVDYGTYKISSSSSSAIQMEFYDSNLNLISSTPNMDVGNMSGYFEFTFNQYSDYFYYIVKYSDVLVFGTIQTTIEWLN